MNDKEYIRSEMKKTEDIYNQYFKNSDCKLTLSDLKRMRGMTILVNNECTDSALLYGILSL